MIFTLNVLLALSWMALSGEFEPLNFVEGFILAYLLLRLVFGTGRRQSYFRRGPRLIRFTLFYLKELLLANIRVAVIVLSPKLKISPSILEIPLENQSDLSIFLLANLITLTPGTLTLDISADRQALYVHTMYAKDVESFRASIKMLESRVMEVSP